MAKGRMTGLIISGLCLLTSCYSPESLAKPSKAASGQGQGTVISHEDLKSHTPASAAVHNEQTMFDEGYVVGKKSTLNQDNIHYKVLLIHGISEEQAINASPDEVMNEAIARSGAWYRVTREQFDELKRGYQIRVETGPEQEDSLPPGRTAVNIEVLNKGRERVPFQYRDEVFTGSVLQLNVREQWMDVNISDWVNRNNNGPIDDMLHSIRVQYDGDTRFQNEQGESFEPDSLRIGDKIDIVNKGAESFDYRQRHVPIEVAEINLLSMSRSEKLEYLLAQSVGDIHTVIMHDEGQEAPWNGKEIEKYIPGAIYGGYGSVEYQTSKAVDYKNELNLQQLPMLLVFDREDLLYQTASIHELRHWFNLRAAEERELGGKP